MAVASSMADIWAMCGQLVRRLDRQCTSSVPARSSPRPFADLPSCALPSLACLELFEEGVHHARRVHRQVASIHELPRRRVNLLKKSLSGWSVVPEQTQTLPKQVQKRLVIRGSRTLGVGLEKGAKEFSTRWNVFQTAGQRFSLVRISWPVSTCTCLVFVAIITARPAQWGLRGRGCSACSRP